MDGIGSNSWEMTDDENQAGGEEDSAHSRNDLPQKLLQEYL